jgi:hypothetical protein
MTSKECGMTTMAKKPAKGGLKGYFAHVSKGSVIRIGEIQITVSSGSASLAIVADGQLIDVHRRSGGRRSKPVSGDGE